MGVATYWTLYPSTYLSPVMIVIHIQYECCGSIVIRIKGRETQVIHKHFSLLFDDPNLSLHIVDILC